MKFLRSFILLSSFLSVSLAYPCDVQDIPEPSHQLFDQYSKLHIQQPKSVDPNTSFLTLEIPFGEDGKFDLSISLLTCSHSKRVDIQHAYECDLYLPHLSKYEHSHYHKFELASLGNGVEDLLEAHDNDTWLPTQYDNLDYLRNVNFCDILTYRKFKKFIETKVTAMELQGFNL